MDKMKKNITVAYTIALPFALIFFFNPIAILTGEC